MNDPHLDPRYDPHLDDLRAPLDERRRLGRHYRGLLPIALVIVVVWLGWMGHQSGSQVTNAPSQAAFAATGAPSASAAPASGEPTVAAGPPGIAADLFSSSLAAGEGRIYYTIGNQMLLSTGWSADSAPQLLEWVGPCRTIDGVAVSGTTVLFVRSDHGGVTTNAAASSAGCDGSGSVAWEIVSYDTESHAERTLANGTTPMNHFDPTAPPVHVAISGTEFAFERLAYDSESETGWASTVEVRSLASGSLEWSARVNGGVRSLMLGGGRVAAVTSTLGLPALYLLSRSSGPQLVAAATTGGSLSADGRYLVWDSAGQAGTKSPSLMLMDVETSAVRGLGAVLAPPGFPSVEPAVSATPDGPVVAWYAARPARGLSVRFVDPAHPNGAWLETGATPSWMSVQDDNLVYLEPPSVGTALLVHAEALRTTPLASVGP